MWQHGDSMAAFMYLGPLLKALMHKSDLQTTKGLCGGLVEEYIYCTDLSFCFFVLPDLS